MDKYCCVCNCLIDSEDYDRIGPDYYCLRCSNNELVFCMVCDKPLHPDIGTDFQGPDGHLFCSAECMDAMTVVCPDCGREFVNVEAEVSCPFCKGECRYEK